MSIDISNENQVQRVIIAVVDTGEYDVESSIKELTLLVETAGGEVVAEVIQKMPKPDNKTYLGSGKLKELIPVIEDTQADTLITDTELKASSFRNIREIIEIDVIDRTMLILDIFAQHALSAEGKLQVELAQLQHILLTLSGLGQQMSRLGGGIGTRGPGETKLETDRRHIRARISYLEKTIEEISDRRALTRARRKKSNVPIVSLVGYTNVGKSSLLNALTGADVYAEDKLFATLDSTLRRLNLRDMQEVIMVDTVGFVSRLPHHLIDAFSSTLEEMTESDIILKVADASSSEYLQQLEVADEMINRMGCSDIPQIVVFNKCDLIDQINLPGVMVSAKTGYGLDMLLQKIADILLERAIRGRFIIPFDKLSLVSIIRQKGIIHTEEYIEEGLEMVATIDSSVYYIIEQYRMD
ncbi:MAG: GTPase HflX [Oscillospiraceae bacterium]|nr:GTPase HflX [Oscillospiraceae bacterium]